MLGWLQGLVAGPIKETKCFCLLIDKTLQWYKNPPGKIVGQEPLRGKISGLGNLFVFPDTEFKEILLLLDANQTFTVEHKGGTSWSSLKTPHFNDNSLVLCPPHRLISFGRQAGSMFRNYSSVRKSVWIRRLGQGVPLWVYIDGSYRWRVRLVS